MSEIGGSIDMAERNGKCIRRIFLRLTRQIQNHLHHVLNLLLAGTPGADHGKFDLTSGILRNAEVMLDAGSDRNPSCLTQDQR